VKEVALASAGVKETLTVVSEAGREVTPVGVPSGVVALAEGADKVNRERVAHRSAMRVCLEYL
jgi:hypothetical protein